MVVSAGHGGGQLILRVDDTNPNDASSMMLWCIDYDDFGIALVAGIDRTEKSHVTAFAELHGDHCVQHIAYRVPSLIEFTNEMKTEAKLELQGPILQRHDAYGWVWQVFAKVHHGGANPAVVPFTEFVERPQVKGETFPDIFVSADAGTNLYQQAQRAMKVESSRRHDRLRSDAGLLGASAHRQALTRDRPRDGRRRATRTFVQIPTDTSRPAVPVYEAGACEAALTLVDEVAAEGAQAKLLAAIAGLLQRYTQQAEIGFDLFVERQPGAWAHRALQTPLSAEGSLEGAIGQMTAEIAAAMAVLAESAGAPRGAATSNIAVFRLGWRRSDQLPHALRPRWPPGALRDRRTISTSSFPVGDSRRGSRCSTTLLLLRPTTASRLLANVATLFVGLQARPAAALRQLPLLSADEEKTIEVAWDSGRALSSRLPRPQAVRAPGPRAARGARRGFKDRRITYGELEAATTGSPTSCCRAGAPSR